MSLSIIIINFITIKFYNDIFIRDKSNNKNDNKNEDKKEDKNKYKVIKKIIRFILITCNTILYCVLYKKVENIYYMFYSIYFLILVYIGMYDIKNKIITNKSNVILFIAGLILLIVNNLDRNIYKLLIIKLLTMIVLFFILLLIRKMFKNNIGGGDIKMIIMLMINNNLSNMFMIITISVFTSLIFALYLLIVKRKSKNYKFSFGEFISLGTIIVTLLN